MPSSSSSNGQAATTVIGVNALSRYWEQVVSTHGPSHFECGLLIGQETLSSKGRATVQIQSCVPIPSEDPTQDPSLSTLPRVWLQQYSKQIESGLPGGFQVLGLYLVSQMETKKLTLQMQGHVNAVAQKGGIFIHIHHKTTCWKTSSSQREMTLLRITYVEKIEWKRFTSVINVNVAVSIDSLVKEQHNKNDCEKNSLSLVHQRMDTIKTKLKSHVESEIAASRSIGRISQQDSSVVDFMYVVPATEPETEDSDPTEEQQVSLSGSVQCIGYTTTTTAVENNDAAAAVKAIKQDYVRSIVTRIDVLCEDWEQNAEQLENDQNALQASCAIWRSGGALQLPKRGLFPWPGVAGAAFDTSVYVLKEERPEEALANALEILNVSVDETVATTLEVVEEFASLECTSVDNSRLGKEKQKRDDDDDQDAFSHRRRYYYIIAIILALVALLLSVLLAGLQ